MRVRPGAGKGVARAADCSRRARGPGGACFAPPLPPLRGRVSPGAALACPRWARAAPAGPAPPGSECQVSACAAGVCRTLAMTTRPLSLESLCAISPSFLYSGVMRLQWPHLHKRGGRGTGAGGSGPGLAAGPAGRARRARQAGPHAPAWRQAHAGRPRLADPPRGVKLHNHVLGAINNRVKVLRGCGRVGAGPQQEVSRWGSAKAAAYICGFARAVCGARRG